MAPITRAICGGVRGTGVRMNRISWLPFERLVWKVYGEFKDSNELNQKRIKVVVKLTGKTTTGAKLLFSKRRTRRVWLEIEQNFSKWTSRKMSVTYRLIASQSGFMVYDRPQTVLNRLRTDKSSNCFDCNLSPSGQITWSLQCLLRYIVRLRAAFSKNPSLICISHTKTFWRRLISWFENQLLQVNSKF